MPCTFCHPLAVLPLRKLIPGRLNFAALVVGSMSPDFGYYCHQFSLAGFAHSFAGTFLVGLPGGLLVLAALYLLRGPLCFILPRPHRTAVEILLAVPPHFNAQTVSLASASLLLGAWTHAGWDSFTHASGWVVRHVGLLRLPAAEIGGTVLPCWSICQQVSTLSAGIALAVIYHRWLRRERLAGGPTGASERWRYLLLGSLAALALAIVAPQALRMSSQFSGFFAIRVFLFRTAIGAGSAFVAAVVFAGLIIYAIRKRSDRGAN